MDLIIREFLRPSATPWLTARRRTAGWTPTQRNPNWQALEVASDLSRISHAIDRLTAFGQGDTAGDHLGHAADDIMFMIWFVRNPAESLLLG